MPHDVAENAANIELDLDRRFRRRIRTKDLSRRACHVRHLPPKDIPKYSTLHDPKRWHTTAKQLCKSVCPIRSFVDNPIANPSR